MARRPKRTLSAELARHNQIAAGAANVVSALHELYPDLPEFMGAKSLMEAGCKALEKRYEVARAEEAEAPQS